VSTLLLTFTFSFDEFPVSLFLAGSNPTYPIVAWGLLSKKIPTPEANAAATLILVISFVFVLLANKVQKGGTIFRI
jgi:spermidine/putrescine transport system permease protein